MAERVLHKVKERKQSEKGPDEIITECGENGEVKGGWEFVNCPKCLNHNPSYKPSKEAVRRRFYFEPDGPFFEE